MPNRFENLYVDDDDVNHDKNERKAKKKLKAIEKLKKKENLTDEEQKKIDSEDYWQLILNPFYQNKEKQREAKQRAEQREAKQRQREAKQRAEQRQREAEQRQREAEQRQREAEQRQREAEQRQRQRQEPKEIKTRNEKKIDIELSVLLNKGISVKKAKHNLLLKYHPDKNKGNTANEMTQYINNIVIK